MKSRDADRTPAERGFADAWVDERQSWTSVIQALSVTPLIIVLAMANNPSNIRPYKIRILSELVVSGYAGVICIALLAFILRRPVLFKISRAGIVAMAIALQAVMAAYSRAAVARFEAVSAVFPDTGIFGSRHPIAIFGEAFDEANLIGIAYFSLCFTTLLLSQVPARVLLAEAFLLVLFAILAFHDHPDRFVYFTVGIPIIVGATAGGLARLRGQRHAAYIELERRMLVEREALLVYEKDMEIARRIQDSILPPAIQRFQNDIAVHSYRESHAAIGGDWLGIHETQAGELVVAVADVAGKGVHAALTAHAIQSVWTLATGAPTFDPPTFLQELNGALAILGKKKIQTATMGILLVKDGRARYWSAAHQPLQLVTTDAKGAPRTEVFAPRGTPLGIDGAIDLEVAEIPLPRGSRASLLVGTDGVFKALEGASETVVTLLERMRQHGIEVVRQIRANDDKTLVWLVYDPSLSERPASPPGAS